MVKFSLRRTKVIETITFDSAKLNFIYVVFFYILVALGDFWTDTYYSFVLYVASKILQLQPIGIFYLRLVKRGLQPYRKNLKCQSNQLFCS